MAFIVVRARGGLAEGERQSRLRTVEKGNKGAGSFNTSWQINLPPLMDMASHKK